MFLMSRSAAFGGAQSLTWVVVYDFVVCVLSYWEVVLCDIFVPCLVDYGCRCSHVFGQVLCS